MHITLKAFFVLLDAQTCFRFWTSSPTDPAVTYLGLYAKTVKALDHKWWSEQVIPLHLPPSSRMRGQQAGSSVVFHASSKGGGRKAGQQKPATHRSICDLLEHSFGYFLLQFLISCSTFKWVSSDHSKKKWKQLIQQLWTGWLQHLTPSLYSQSYHQYDAVYCCVPFCTMHCSLLAVTEHPFLLLPVTKENGSCYLTQHFTILQHTWVSWSIDPNIVHIKYLWHEIFLSHLQWEQKAEVFCLLGGKSENKMHRSNDCRTVKGLFTYLNNHMLKE